MPCVQINSDTQFSSELSNSSLVMVDFYADWCKPCVRIAPELEKFSETYKSDCKILKVNIEQMKELGSAFGIRSLPTFLFFKDGKQVKQISGANPSLIESTIQQLIAGEDVTEKPLQGANHRFANLKDIVMVKQIDCANYKDTRDYLSLFEDNGKCLESDCDEELILSIPFNASVKVHSLVVKNLSYPSAGPKNIRLFTNMGNLPDFDDARELKAVQKITITSKHLKGEPIKLDYLKFQNVNNLILFIENNQKDTPTTIIDQLEIFGESNSDTNMSDFKRVAGKAGEQHE